MAHAVRQEPRDDFTIDQYWEEYTEQEHAVWRTLFERQVRILRGRAVPEFMDGLDRLGVAADAIPDFRRLNGILDRTTGWTIVAVPGLVPNEVFFWHLANRRFPSTCFIRTPEQMDYLQEPDIFHDVFGHVPLLINPVFADYMQAYGEGGLKALRLDGLEYLSRLYWYTVEFGLIRKPEGTRIYGSGIVSSKSESVYALDSAAPNRVAFDLMRVMRTDYRIDDHQETYFVIDDFEQLFEATRPDFAPYYDELRALPDLTPSEVLAGDTVIHRGEEVAVGG